MQAGSGFMWEAFSGVFLASLSRRQELRTRRKKVNFQPVEKKGGRTGRPQIGMGSKAVCVSIERTLLRDIDALAKNLCMSRAAMIAEGLRHILQRNSALHANAPARRTGHRRDERRLEGRIRPENDVPGSSLRIYWLFLRQRRSANFLFFAMPVRIEEGVTLWRIAGRDGYEAGTVSVPAGADPNAPLVQWFKTRFSGIRLIESSCHRGLGAAEAEAVKAAHAAAFKSGREALHTV